MERFASWLCLIHDSYAAELKEALVLPHPVEVINADQAFSLSIAVYGIQAANGFELLRLLRREFSLMSRPEALRYREAALRYTGKKADKRLLLDVLREAKPKAKPSPKSKGRGRGRGRSGKFGEVGEGEEAAEEAEEEGQEPEGEQDGGDQVAMMVKSSETVMSDSAAKGATGTSCTESPVCLSVLLVPFGFSSIPEVTFDMDLDDVDSPKRSQSPKGFRKRWKPHVMPQPNVSEPLTTVEPSFPDDDVLSLFDGSCFPESPLDDTVDGGDWSLVGSHVSFPGVDIPAETLKRPWEAPDSDRCSDVFPHVLDPSRVETAWKSAAISAEFKRARNSFDKLPWEQEGYAFRSSNMWHGTALSSFDKMFTCTTIGAQDVWNSQVVSSRPASFCQGASLPVVPITLKRARREPLDEDIRRQEFRDLILQDPLATQLGTSLRGLLEHGMEHDEVDQSFRDCFRMKASSTLQKRAASLVRLAKFLRAEGQLNPLRLSEPELYRALCSMRLSGAGATSAQHVVEALHFLDATAKLTAVSVSEILSARCRGVARDMYLLKSPLQQKIPLTVEQVRKLEMTIFEVSTVFQCILGQLLFCIHACCRWKDGQKLKSLEVESGHGETLLYADALSSKTTLTAESKTRFLPYAAINTGVTGEDWSRAWLGARHAEGLTFEDFVLPSFSERQACWLGTPMSASEAACWLREFLDGTIVGSPSLLGSHSCKATLLTWAGRCLRAGFTPSDRRLLGHHLDPRMKSVLCYSRESFTSLYSKVLTMLRLIRTEDFQPDLPAIDRVVQWADEDTELQTGPPVEATEPVEVLDSDSSLASCDSDHDDMQMDMERLSRHCLFTDCQH
eukprot:s464_g30.t1